MAVSKKDPTEPIRNRANRYPDVEEGMSCNQAAFKVRKQAFLYIGPQGGRYKAMFKLNASRADAEKLAKSDPDHYETGSTAWVTARFTAEEPLPKTLWQKWLEESFRLSLQGGKANAKKKPARKIDKKPKAAGRAKSKVRRKQ